MARGRFAACAAGALVAIVAGAAACSPSARHATLVLFFDGVPPLSERAAPDGAQTTAAAAMPMRAGLREHGPYGAKLCNSCHLSTASNSYVAPRKELCAHCHDLDLDKAFVHGPIASEGCTACHDPHSSPYPYLLSGSPETFCFRCHDRGEVESVAAHKDAASGCTTCHDPHQSDDRHLLRAKS